MNRPARLAATGTPARFSTAEFLHMAEVGAFDDIKVELVNGEIERMNPPMGLHGQGQAQMIALLAQALGKGRVLGETGIDLDNDTVLACDAAVLSSPLVEHRLVRPDELLLVVEIAETTLARDLGMKLARYAEAGVPNYWVVDGARRIVHVHAAPVDSDYSSTAAVRFGEPLAVPGTDATITLD